MKRRAAIFVLLVLIVAALFFALQWEPEYRVIAKEFGHRPARGVAVQHVRLFDSETGKVLAGQTVVVVGDRIAAVGPDQSVKLPEGAETIDGAGRTLLPGLVDMHAHLAPSAGLPYLASGVTTVRDLGNRLSALVELKKKWESGEEIGPSVLMAGPINSRRGKGELVSSEAEVNSAIGRYREAGYVQIKILGELKPSLVACAAKSAHASGMRVSGHVPEGMKADEFVQAGVDEVQHMHYVVKNFCRSGEKTTTTEADEGSRLDVDSPAVTEWIQLLKRKGIVIDPTLNVYEAKYGKRGGTSQAYYEVMLRMLKRLYDEGVPLVAGSDGPRDPGASLHREMEIWTNAGIPAPKVLQVATIGAARVMKLDGQIGSIRAGKRADVVLVDGDPTLRIDDVRKCRLVIKKGTIYHCADLEHESSTSFERWFPIKR